MLQVGTFVNQILLNISENLRSKDQRLCVITSPNMVKTTVLEPQLHSIQLETFVNQRHLLGQCWAFLKTWGPKVKGRVQHTTQYGQNYSFDSITPSSAPGGNYCQRKRPTEGVLSVPENLRVKSYQITKYGHKCSFGAITTFEDLGSNFCHWKHFLGHCWEFPKVKVTRWPTVGQNAVFEHSVKVSEGQCGIKTCWVNLYVEASHRCCIEIYLSFFFNLKFFCWHTKRYSPNQESINFL